MFSHVGDAQLQKVLAETLYGARWIYKLGLALLVRDVEQMAHVRQQVVDYGAVCEGLLSDMIHHNISSSRMTGQKYKYSNITHLQGPINWGVTDTLSRISRQGFYWLIEVAHEESIISDRMEKRLHKMRTERNTVHLRARTYQTFIKTSRSLYQTMYDLVVETQAWKAANP